MVSVNENFQKLFKSWLLRKTSKDTYVISTDIPNVSIGSALGLVRKDNQDKAIVAQFRSRCSTAKSYTLFALADGMGGMIDGAECASLLLSNFLFNLIESREHNLFKKLSLATNQANDAVYNKYQGRGGATLSAVLFDSVGVSSAVNVGDSRIFTLNRENKFKQITVDDTIDGQLAKINKEPSHLPESNRLVQYIGMGEGLELSESKLPSRSFLKGFVLTSDGAHFVGNVMLEGLLVNAPNASVFNNRLLSLALWQGGHDNATSICVNWRSINDICNHEMLDNQVIKIWDCRSEFLFPYNFSERDVSSSFAKEKKEDTFQPKKKSGSSNKEATKGKLVNIEGRGSAKGSDKVQFDLFKKPSEKEDK